MLLVSFLIKMKVRSQQYQEQTSVGPHGCAKSKEEEPKCILLSTAPAPVALQCRLHWGPLRLPLECCLEVMWNWERLLLGSLGSFQLGFLIKYWKLQCRNKAAAIEFVWLLWIRESRRGWQKVEEERGSKETERTRCRKRKTKRKRGTNSETKRQRKREREGGRMSKTLTVGVWHGIK